MNGPEFDELLKKQMRGSLTAEDDTALQARFRHDSSAEAAWEEDLRLNQLLQQVPDAPISSNFTARVLGAIELEEKKEARRSPWRGVGQWLRVGLARKAALATIIAGVSMLTYHQYRSGVREEMARNAAAVSSIAALPSVDVLENFEIIQGLNQLPPVDVDLLAALQ